MEIYYYIGLFASIFGLTQQLPQIYEIIKTKSAQDLSYGTLFLIIINQIFWFIYAIHIKNTVYTINATGHFVIDFIELILKIYYDRRKRLIELENNI